MPHSIDKLKIPSHPGLVEALGRLAIAHTHLELILRYVVKTLSELSVNDALDATSGDSTSEVRRRIKKLFKEKKPVPSDETQLDSLLGAARRLSEKRNAFLHSAWSQTEAGEIILKQEDHQWGPAPSKEQVDQITDQIMGLANKINNARLTGFISEVIKRHKETEK